MARNALLSAAAVLLLAAPAGRADEPGELRLDLEVGEVASLCPCPVITPVCDDPSVVELVDMGGTPGLRALKPGSTTCSVHSATGLQRIYRVRVRPAGPGDGGAGGATGG